MYFSAAVVQMIQIEFKICAKYKLSSNPILHENLEAPFYMPLLSKVLRNKVTHNK